MTLRPMNFQEFLLANGEDMMVEYLTREITKPEPNAEVFVQKLQNHLTTCFITDGSWRI